MTRQLRTPATAHRAANGTFQNPWPDSESQGFGAVLRWMASRPGASRAPTPPRNSLATATPVIAHPRAAHGTTAATWIGHSTVLMQLGALNVLTDPMFSRRASPVPWAGPGRVMDAALSIDSLPPIDVVLQSHNHYDHLDKASVKRIAAAHPDAVWVVPLGVATLLRKWGVRETVELDWWQEATVGAMRVTATPACHFSSRSLNDRNRTLWCGFAIEVGSTRAYFAGDSAYHPEFGDIGAQCGPFDFVMMPIGAYDPRWFMHVVHMDPQQAVRAYRDIIAAHPDAPLPVMLGVHWGTFRLTDEPMDEPPRLTRTSWHDAGLDESRLWIAAFGETRAGF